MSSRSGLSRRGFLLGSAAAAVLVAPRRRRRGERDDRDDGRVGGRRRGRGRPGPRRGVRSQHAAGGRHPAAAQFVLFEQTGGLVALADAPTEIVFTLASEGGGSLPPVTTARHGDDVDRPYYPLVVTFPSTGTWSVQAGFGAGQTLESSVIANDTSTIPQVGQPLPSPSPTTAAPLGVTRICTQDPPCPFHEVSSMPRPLPATRSPSWC